MVKINNVTDEGLKSTASPPKGENQLRQRRRVKINCITDEE
jgi:hypothetical protein